MPSEVTLIVENETDLTAREKAIQSRLSDRLEYQVRVQGHGADLAPTDAVRLVVVCARHVPGELRTLELPVLVCNVGALYDLGMTMAKENVDFGTQPYSSVFIGPEAIGEPLPAGIMERRQVTEEKEPQGWARPGAKALVVATVGGDSTKPVVFSYEKGDAMPGLDAAHRRGAFLATGDAKGQLKAEGWILFDVAVKSLIEGGQWADRPGPAGLWFLKDGSPTRAMSAGEYRDWVHDQVSDDVFKRLRVYGFGGFGTLLTVLLIIWGAVTYYIGATVREQADKTQTRVDSQIEKVTAQQMAQLMFNEKSKIWEEVQGKLKAEAEKNIDKAIIDPKIKAQVEEVVTAYVNGKTADELLKQYDLSKKENNAKKRSLLLRLCFVYAATEKQQSTLRQIVRDAVTDEDEFVRATALENYLPSDIAEEAKIDLDKILPLFDFKKSSPAVRDAYATLIPKFYDDHAEILLDWLRKNDNLFAPNSKDLLLSVARLKKKDEAKPKVFNRLMDYTVGQDDLKSAWATRALTILMKDNFKLNIGAKARQDAFEKLAKELNTRSPAKGKFIYDSYDPLRTDFTSSILVALFGPEDEVFLAGKVGSGERSNSKSLQAMLFNFAIRLENENKRVPGKVANQLFKVGDVLAGEGTARLVAHAIRHGEPNYARTFFDGLPNTLIEGLPDLDAKWTGRDPYLFAKQAVLAAVESDARGEPPFQLTTKLWWSLASKEKQEKTHEHSETKDNDDKLARIKNYLKQALGNYCRSASRQVGDLAKLQSVLETTEPETRDLVSLKLLGDLADNVIRQARVAYKWDIEIKVHEHKIRGFGQLIEQEKDPLKSADLHIKRAKAYFERGQVYYSKLRLNTPAVADFSKAIDMQKEVVAKHAKNDEKKDDKRKQQKKQLDAFYYARGNAHLHSGKVDEAIADYLNAIDIQEKGFNDSRGNAHKQLSLAYILQRDKDKAEKHVKLAVDAYSSPQKKAGAQENKGLLYLTLGEWDLAFRNTEDAKSFYSSSPWNWIIRYIAAREAKEKAAAEDTKDKWERLGKDAKDNWQKLGVPNDLSHLSDYIPGLLIKHLGILPQKHLATGVPVIRDRLLPGTSDPKATALGKSVAKLSSVRLKAGKTYIIDMESLALDAYLIFLDSADKELDRNDDGGGGRNARIQFVAKEDGDYQIIATSFEGNAQGAYSLIIRELRGEVP
jgi:hypothetical protein